MYEYGEIIVTTEKGPTRNWAEGNELSICHLNDNEYIIYENKEEQDNGRLIAAPDLLAACKEYLRLAEPVGSGEVPIEEVSVMQQRLRQAVIKAEGEE